jgi:hypothetical protein
MIHALYVFIGAVFGWSLAMFVIWLQDAGIVEFWRVRFVDEDGEWL